MAQTGEGGGAGSSRWSTLTLAAAFGTGAGVLFASWKVANYFAQQLERKALVAKYRAQLLASPEQLQRLRAQFVAQLETGLQTEVEPCGKHMLMLPTYVTELPTGEEVGDAFAIDMGGTNFRIMHVKLTGKSSELNSDLFQVHVVKIPCEVYTGSGQGLFEFLAQELISFIRAHPPTSTMTPDCKPVVGFCFSFPMAQTALDRGMLLDWTKGFTCTGVVGEDPVRLLSEALERAGQPCHIAALLNDTVGVLAAQRYLEPTTTIGVIIGTGTNACYVERLARLTKWRDAPADKLLDPSSKTAVNIEWGSFFSEDLPRCQEDLDLDAASSNPGKYLYEKLVSGLFLGEVAGRILLSLSGQTQLLGDFTPGLLGLGSPAAQQAADVLKRLALPGSFNTAHLAAVVSDQSRMLEGVAQVLEQALGASRQLVPFSSRQVVHEVCTLVALRSAQMVAVGLDAILSYTSDSPTPQQQAIVFDGGVYEQFAAYRAMVRATLSQLRGEPVSEDESSSAKLRLLRCHEGSCLGAAVLAAAACKKLSAPATTAAPLAAAAPQSGPAPPAAAAATAVPGAAVRATAVPAVAPAAPVLAAGSVSQMPNGVHAPAPAPATNGPAAPVGFPAQPAVASAAASAPAQVPGGTNGAAASAPEALAQQQQGDEEDGEEEGASGGGVLAPAQASLSTSGGGSSSKAKKKKGKK